MAAREPADAKSASTQVPDAVTGPPYLVERLLVACSTGDLGALAGAVSQPDTEYVWVYRQRLIGLAHRVGQGNVVVALHSSAQRTSQLSCGAQRAAATVLASRLGDGRPQMA